MYLKKRLLASQRLSSSTNWMVTELRQNEDEMSTISVFSQFREHTNHLEISCKICRWTEITDNTIATKQQFMYRWKKMRERNLSTEMSDTFG
jgi:hypothetical protein